jgi:hypothetical protein
MLAGVRAYGEGLIIAASFRETADNHQGAVQARTAGTEPADEPAPSP